MPLRYSSGYHQHTSNHRAQLFHTDIKQYCTTSSQGAQPKNTQWYWDLGWITIFYWSSWGGCTVMTSKSTDRSSQRNHVMSGLPRFISFYIQIRIQTKVNLNNPAEMIIIWLSLSSWAHCPRTNNNRGRGVSSSMTREGFLGLSIQTASVMQATLPSLSINDTICYFSVNPLLFSQNSFHGQNWGEQWKGETLTSNLGHKNWKYSIELDIVSWQDTLS